jgi:D-alanyl-D-alanine carboxypeptidase
LLAISLHSCVGLPGWGEEDLPLHTSGDHIVKPSRRRSRAARLLVATVVAATPLLVPSTSDAGPVQEPPTTQRDDVDLGPPGTEDDLLKAGSGDVLATLDELSADVQAQVAAVLAARAAEAAATAEVAAADAAVAETEGLIDELTTQSDQVVIEAFINPPAENAMETLSAATLSDATVKQSILTSQSNANADVLTQLEAAQSELAEVKAAQGEAASEAEQRAAEAELALADLVSSQSQESLFVLAVQDRLAASLAEADALATVDPAAAETIRAREAEIAAAIGQIVAGRQQRESEAALHRAMEEAAAKAAAEAAARPSSSSSAGGGGGSLGPATGSLSTVSCPGGGSITVDSSLAGSLRSMLDAAAADGLDMCGGGYRDPAAQIAVRRANCGTSNYAIYEAPPSSCSPPTARPGTSMHEQGLAIDFTCNGGGSLSTSSPCFSWLRSNADSYGLYNLPSEPWHWSTDGT